MTRRALSKRTRFEIFKRDHFTCTYCGQRPPEVMLQVDHIVAVAANGSNDPDNLTTSCTACNAGKGANGLGVAMPQVPEDVRLEAIQESLERAATLAHQQEAAAVVRQAEDAVADQVEDHWASCYGYEDGDKIYWPDRRSVVRFTREGLSVLDLLDAVEVTAGKLGSDDWRAPRYFYGVCWGKIRDRRKAELANG